MKYGNEIWSHGLINIVLLIKALSAFPEVSDKKSSKAFFSFVFMVLNCGKINSL